MEETLKRLQELSTNELDHIYQDLETLCLTFPGRVTGSKSLEKAIDFLYEDTKKVIPENCCKKEMVTNVSRWVRYGNFGQFCYETNSSDPTLTDLKNRQEERCFIDITPTESSSKFPVPYPNIRQIRLLANGLSVGTPPEGIKGDIVIITTWEQLDEEGKKGNLQGKIVLYDYLNFVTYGEVAGFRYSGGERAMEYGAIGVLVRTLTPNHSVSGPHTGVQSGKNKIPSACISVEDTEMIRRLMERGFHISATVIMPCGMSSQVTTSHNLLFEIPGTEKPEEIIVIGGHIDSWDCQHGCCQGAHDDGQAVAIAVSIVKLLHRYGLAPKRTIRAVVFTDEEVTQTGALQYQASHSHEADRVIAAIETDCGIGPVVGFAYQFHGHQPAVQLFQEILSIIPKKFPDIFSQTLPIGLAPRPAEVLESLQLQESHVGVDISPMVEKDGIAGLLLKHADDWWNDAYFHFHHSPSDSIDHIDKGLLRENFLVLLFTVWLLADHPDSSQLLRGARGQQQQSSQQVLSSLPPNAQEKK